MYRKLYTFNAEHSSRAGRHRIAILLVLSWLILTAYAFWWFHFRYLYSINSTDQWVMFSSDQLEYSDSTHDDIPTLIHFHDPNCPCSRFVVPDVKYILETFSEQVRVRVFVPDSASVEQANRMFGVNAEIAPFQTVPVASPAAWLMTADGQTAYLGPYSDSGICSSSASHQVSTLITDLLDGQELTATNHLTTGCFCSWPKITHSS